MTSPSTPNSSLLRFRPAILILTALAAGYTAYYIHSSLSSLEETPKTPLHRRNAVHRRNRERVRRNSRASTENRPTISAADLLRYYQLSYTEDFGTFRASYEGVEFVCPLSSGRFPTLRLLQDSFRGDRAAAESAREQYEVTVLTAFLTTSLNTTLELQDPGGLDVFVSMFRNEGFINPERIRRTLQAYNAGRLTDHDVRPWEWEDRNANSTDDVSHSRSRAAAAAAAAAGGVGGSDSSNDPSGSNGPDPDPDSASTLAPRAADNMAEDTRLRRPGRGSSPRDAWNRRPRTVLDEGSEHSWQDGDDDNTRRKDRQSFLNLLYNIAEEQSRNEGYLHRNIHCNSCHIMPIRGIRYHCTNCIDYDLCEQCESMQIHPKTHVFYKIRVPAPFLTHPIQPHPPWYPGRSIHMMEGIGYDTGLRFSRESKFELSEVQAYWEQFKCLAATDWPQDPDGFGMALDRKTFNKCFVTRPNRTSDLPKQNLIYDRLFAIYDTDNNGLIGYSEFIMGIAAIKNKLPDERLKKIFKGFDLDGDGYVGRRDFLRMFAAHYAIIKDFTQEMVSALEEDALDTTALHYTIGGSQPVSSAFTGRIPVRERARYGDGKVEDETGELFVYDDKGVVRESGRDECDMNQVVGDRSEIAEFGDLENPNPGPGDLPTFSTENEQLIELLTKDIYTEMVLRTEDWQYPPEIATLLAPWPFEFISPVDVVAVLDSPMPAVEITNHHQQLCVSIVAAKRIRKQRTLILRPDIRRKGIEGRWERRHFYLGGEETGDLPNGSSPQDCPRSDELSISSRHLASPTTGIAQLGDHIPHSVPEEGFGRDIVYQITQEGLNELLDPAFLLREDLAMEEVHTADERSELRTYLNEYLAPEGVRKLCSWQLRRFQENWRAPHQHRLKSEKGSQAAELQHIIKQENIEDTDEYYANVADMRRFNLISPEELMTKIANLPEGGKNQELVQLSKELLKKFKGHQQLSVQQVEVDREAGQIKTKRREELDEAEGAQSLIISLTEFPETRLLFDDAVSAFFETRVAPEDKVMETILRQLLDFPNFTLPSRDGGQEFSHDYLDPTLPQNRPNGPSSTWSGKAGESSIKGKGKAVDAHHSIFSVPADWKHDAAFQQKLKFLAMMDILRDEDKARGGPGKLSFDEFAELMRGPKGDKLGFVGAWIELSGF